MLQYKEDMGKTIERFKAFWEHEIIDRVCISVTAPRKDNNLTSGEEFKINPRGQVMEEMDPDYIVRAYNAQMTKTYFGGDALPIAHGQGCLLYPAYGGNGYIKGKTVWVDPIIDKCQEWTGYRFDLQNIWIQKLLTITKALAKDAPGKYLVGSPGVFGAMDAMTMMMDMSQFYMDLATGECDDVLIAAHRECIRGFRLISEEIYNAADNGQQYGAVVYPELWAPDRINYWSADFSGAISPKLFEKWVVPEIEEMASLYKYSIYHLDGPDATRHLPVIAETKGLQGIQYTRGAGTSLADAIPVYKQIQKLGKIQYIDVDYKDVERIMEELDPGGIFIMTEAPDIQIAEELLKKVEKWSVKH